MVIKLKSLKDPIDKKADGLRIAIVYSLFPYDTYVDKIDKHGDRYGDKYDIWYHELGPSQKLFYDTRSWNKNHNNKDISGFWPEYTSRFISQINNDPKAQQLLEKLSIYIKSPKNCTFLCHCINEQYCHRSLVKEQILNKFR